MKTKAKIPTEPPANAAILTVAEAAWVMRSSVDLVYRLVARGDLAGTRVASKLFVARKAIGEYLARNTTTRRPEAVRPTVPASVGLKESGLWDGTDY